MTDSQVGSEGPLCFLGKEEKDAVLAAAGSVRVSDGAGRLHPRVTEHKRILSERSRTRMHDARKMHMSDASEKIPFLAGTVSEAALPRVYRILDALVRALEPLRCTVGEGFAFVIRGEVVPLEIHEMQDKVPHVLTKQEEARLRKYSEEEKRYSWASEPMFRKYDYVFNGKVSICATPGRYIRDTGSRLIEERLGEVLIGLFESSELVRKEAESRRQEEKRLAGSVGL